MHRPSCRATLRRSRDMSSTGPAIVTTCRFSPRETGSRCRRPRGARLINPAAEDREQSMLVTATWNRSRQGALAWSGSLTLGQASSTPPFAGEPLVASMERLRDGPVYEMAAAGESRRRRTALSWRGEAVPVRWLGLRHHPEFGATASWTGVKRKAPGSSLLGELVDGEPARAWEYTSDGGTSRWGRIRSGAVGDRRDRHHAPDRRRPRAARLDRGRFARRREHPLEHAVAQHPRDVSRHQQRVADVPRRLRGVRRAAAAQLPGVRRSARADRLGASMERRQRRPHPPDQ